MGTGLSSAGVFAKWGAIVALAGGLVLPHAQQPPSSPADPTFSFPSTISVPPSGTKPSKPVPPPPSLPRAVTVDLKVERDGGLTVRETVTVPTNAHMTRTVELKTTDTGGHERVLTVRDIQVDGNGTAEVIGDRFVIKLDGGSATVRYRVDGAISDAAGHQEVRWEPAGGWDTKLLIVRAVFAAPKPPEKITCLAGPKGSTTPCQVASTDHGGVPRVVQQNLDPGSRIDLSVQLPADTVTTAPPPAPEGSADAEPGPFALGLATGIGLGLVLLGLLLGVVLLVRARRRDTAALAGLIAPVHVLVHDNGRVAFRAPRDVLPGQLGTVIDERVDSVDLAATVVDLAVRGYLWILEFAAEDGTADWQLVRRLPADGALTGYERAVYDAVLPGDTGTVVLSQLRPELGLARDALHRDVVARGWFASARGLTAAGAVLTVLGCAATVVLALTAGYALLGVAAVIAGLALLLGARLLPARTRTGADLVADARGLVDALRGMSAASIPDADREPVFSRALPYALVLGEGPTLVHAFTEQAPHITWYGAQEGAPFDRFAPHFPTFLAALDHALATGGSVPVRPVDPTPVS